MIDKQKTKEFDNSTTTRYFLLNTNSANDLEDHNFMMTNQVAAAFEDGYKEKSVGLKRRLCIPIRLRPRNCCIWSSNRNRRENSSLWC